MARKIVHYGRSGSVRWSIDKNGTMLFRPVDGNEGTLANPKWKNGQGYIREWENYRGLIKKVEAIGKIYLPENSNRMFNVCYNLTTVDLSHFDTSKATNMDYMFGGCYLLATLDLSSFDTNNVTDMRGMFCGCRSLTSLDLSCLKTMTGKYDSGLFLGCNLLSNLVLSEDIEKTTDDFILLATLFKYYGDLDWTFDCGLNYKILLGHLEKFLNIDLSKEKERLKNFSNLTNEGINKIFKNINEIVLWKSRTHPIKADGVLAILRAHKIGVTEVATDSFQSLEEKGVVSDVNAYLSGVPLEDVLA